MARHRQHTHQTSIDWWSGIRAAAERTTEPERKLWFAVINEALDCLRCRVPGIHTRGPLSRTLILQQQEQDRALEWFRSDDMHAGSFRWVCFLLGLNRKIIVQQLEATKWPNAGEIYLSRRKQTPARNADKQRAIFSPSIPAS